ncbi:MAG: FKBP-type peptidyl-prolyl cis-trans isomerase [Candidatus Micrarchaeia archaeon]
MAIEKGDVVKIEYTAYSKSTGHVIDTTDEKKAKEAGIYDPKKRYGFAVLTVGNKEILEGVDEALIGLEENMSKEFEVPPEKAFGKRDEGLVRIIPLKQFKSAGIDPIPGQVVNIDDTPATIRAVNSGRVITDFNHPLAGVPLKYELKVVKDAKSAEDRARLLAERYDIACTISSRAEGEIEIDMGSVKYDEKNARNTAGMALIARDLMKIKGAKKVSFKGEWVLE